MSATKTRAAKAVEAVSSAVGRVPAAVAWTSARSILMKWLRRPKSPTKISRSSKSTLKSHAAVHAPSGAATGAVMLQGGKILPSGLPAIRRRKATRPSTRRVALQREPSCCKVEKYCRAVYLQYEGEKPRGRPRAEWPCNGSRHAARWKNTAERFTCNTKAKSHEAVHAPSGPATGAVMLPGGKILLSGLPGMRRRKATRPSTRRVVLQQEPSCCKVEKYC